jgi:hypothetical protein
MLHSAFHNQGHKYHWHNLSPVRTEPNSAMEGSNKDLEAGEGGGEREDTCYDNGLIWLFFFFVYLTVSCLV